MTTLTQDTALQPDHCAHKLPSSCRLTARPTCCACQDTRPHASVYRRYVDGLGYVMIGMRQDGYCWPCKVFWDVRMTAASMDPELTRIPFIPDQTDFVNTWHDWHRGFRILISEDGVELRQELRGQPMRQVLIGHLPGTADGSDPYDPRAVKWISMPEVPENLYPSRQQIVPTSEEDRLFDSDEESSSNQVMSNETTAQPTTTSEASNQRQITTSTSTDNSNLLPSDFFFSTTLTTLRSTSLDLEDLTFSLQSEAIRVRQAFNQPELLSDTQYANLLQFVNDLENIANEINREAHIFDSQQERINTMRRSWQTSRPTPPYLPISSDQNAGNSTSNRPLNQTHYTEQPIISPQTIDRRPDSNRQARNAAIAARAGAVLGTREEVQQDDYQSPLTLMFNGITTWNERSERRREVYREQQALLGNIQRQLIRLISLPIPPSEPLTPAQIQLQNNESTLHTNEGNGRPQSPHNTQPLPANDPEIDAVVSSVQHLVLQQLRERLAFPFDTPYAMVRDRIDQVALEYCQAMADILSNRPRRTSVGLGGIDSHHPQDLVQGMLEIVYPREDGETLRTYLARIVRENTVRTTNLPHPTVPVATVGPAHPNVQAPPLPLSTLVEPNFGQLIPGSREWHRQRAQARAILDYGNDGLAQMILERHGLVEAAASLYDPNLLNRPMAPNRPPPTAFNGSNSAGQLEPAPRPLAPIETMVQMQCIVCLEQIADIALVPCGHMVMCRWCSELHKTATAQEFGRRAVATCPLCRQKIQQRLRIWGIESNKKGKEGPAQEDGKRGDDGKGSGGGDNTFSAV